MSRTPESWEDTPESQPPAQRMPASQPRPPSFNPGASAFNPGASAFNPGAGAFTPGGGYGTGYSPYGNPAYRPGPPGYGAPQQPYGGAPYGAPQGAGAYGGGGYYGGQPYGGQPYGGAPQAGGGPRPPMQYQQYQQPQQARPVAPAQTGPAKVMSLSSGEPAKVMSLSSGEPAKVMSLSSGEPAKVLSLSSAGPAKVMSLSSSNEPAKVISLSSSEPAKVVSLSSASPAPAKVVSLSDSKPAAAPAPAPAKVEEPKEEPKPVEPKAEPKSAQPKAEPKAVQPKAESSTPKSESPAPGTPAEPVEDITAKLKEAGIVDDAEGGKDTLNIVFIGHVDAGKSTIGGHLLYLTGQVDKRTLEKYEREAKELNRESWFLSWALDTNPEERSKGKTVEVGRAYIETEKRRFTILDAPGHKNYVPNMIGGAAQADVAILVISAKRGEFESGFDKSGQTREHAALAKANGIKKLVVAINKMDEPTVAWAKERYDEIVEKLKPFLKSCGYNPKTDLDFIPISGYTGLGLKDRVPKDVAPWNDAPGLLEYLDNYEIVDRQTEGPFLMPITEKARDMGTLVGGKIESGRVKVGQKLVVMPNKRTAEVLNIYLDDSEIKSAKSGDNIRLKVRGVEEEELMMGFMLCTPSAPIKTVKAFEVQLVILEHKNIICAGYNAIMHIHAAIEEVVITKLLHLIDKKTKRKSKTPPMFIKAGQVAIVEMEVVSGVVCMETYNNYPSLGRLTIRDEQKTIAMGKVTKLVKLGDMTADAAANNNQSLAENE